MNPPGQLSEDDLALLKRAARHGCRRYHLAHEDMEDCLGDLHVKVLANDGAVVRQYRGLSSWNSYLVSIAINHVKDFVHHLWGKWRPCEEAQRLGPLAIELDRLLNREGLTLDEAVLSLLTRPDVNASRVELEELAARFPERTRPKIIPDAELETRPSAEDSPEHAAAKSESASVFRSMLVILREELGKLDPEDQLLLNLWAEGRRISSLARQLGHDQKSLYGVRDRRLAKLKERFTQAGLDPEQAKAVLRLGEWPEETE